MVCSKSGHFDIFVTWWACVSLLLCCFNVSGFVSTLIVTYIWWFEIPGVQSALQNWQYHCSITSCFEFDGSEVKSIYNKLITILNGKVYQSIFSPYCMKSIPYMGLFNIEFADFCQTIISNYFLYISNRSQLNALRGSKIYRCIKRC